MHAPPRLHRTRLLPQPPATAPPRATACCTATQPHSPTAPQLRPPHHESHDDMAIGQVMTARAHHGTTHRRYLALLTPLQVTPARRPGQPPRRLPAVLLLRRGSPAPLLPPLLLRRLGLLRLPRRLAGLDLPHDLHDLGGGQEALGAQRGLAGVLGDDDDGGQALDLQGAAAAAGRGGEGGRKAGRRVGDGVIEGCRVREVLRSVMHCDARGFEGRADTAPQPVQPTRASSSTRDAGAVHAACGPPPAPGPPPRHRLPNACLPRPPFPARPLLTRPLTRSMLDRSGFSSTSIFTTLTRPSISSATCRAV